MLEEKTPDLLALLTTYARGASLTVSVVPWPPTLAPTLHPLVTLQTKRQKGGKEVKDLKVLRKGKSHAFPSSPQPKRPERPETNRKRAFLLGPLKVLRGNSGHRPLPGGLHYAELKEPCHGRCQPQGSLEAQVGHSCWISGKGPSPTWRHVGASVLQETWGLLVSKEKPCQGM